MSESPRMSISYEDVKAILRGALIAGIGAALASVGAISSVEEFDWRLPAVAFLSAFCSVAANTLRKFMSAPKEDQGE